MGVTPAAGQTGSIRIRDDASAGAWDSFVMAAPDATVYHLSAWAGIIREAFGHRTRQLSAWEGDRLVGILPLVVFRSTLFGRFVTSVPFVNYGGVVASSPAAAQALLDEAVAEARRQGARSLELRHRVRQFPDLSVKTHKVAMVLPMAASAEIQWDGLDRKLRNQVRKAEKSGLTVKVGGVELLDGFYEVFAENMRDLGTPVQAQSFFARIMAALPSQTAILQVLHEGRPIAASFVVWHRGTMEVPWASSLRRYNPLCANVLLYWEMLKFCLAQGCHTFDFGRSTPNEGTYQFKKQWAAVPQALFWEYWLADGQAMPDLSPKNSRFSAAIAVWQRLPVALTRVLGPAIVRNIP